jgi:metal-responsive CopG/Arc/MetJ family transcriptional regulator
MGKSKGGGKKNKEEGLVLVTFKIEDDTLLKIDIYAINHRLSRSDVIREAILNYLKENGILD